LSAAAKACILLPEPLKWLFNAVTASNEGKAGMNISDRYRELTDDVQLLLDAPVDASSNEVLKAQRIIEQAAQEMEELEELVGDIPQMQLESKLTPVLLKSHSQLDRARLLLVEQGSEDHAAAVWELEQKIYRLLNAL
jgi:hypothetical protein